VHSSPIPPRQRPRYEVRGDPYASGGSRSDESALFDYALMRDWIRFVLGAPLRHRRIAIASFVGVLALVGIGLWLLPKTYQVDTRILAQRNQVISLISNPTLTRTDESDAPTRAARETIMRWDNLVALARQTGLVERAEQSRSPAGRILAWVDSVLRRKPPTEAEKLEAVAYTLERRLQVTVQGGVVGITVEWSDPDTAYQLAENVQQGFLETRHATEFNILGDAVAVLETSARRLQEDIAKGTAELTAYERGMRGAGVAGTPRPAQTASSSWASSRPDPETTRMQAQLATKKRALADLEDYRQRRIADAQSQLAQQQTIYADGHPAIQSLRESVASLSKPSPQMEALRAEIGELERELIRRGKDPGGTEVPLTTLLRVDRAPAPLAQGETGDPQLEYLRGKLRTLYNSYGSLLNRIDTARVEMDTAEAAFKYRYSVISPPQMPLKPIKPKPLLIWFGGFIGAIAFSLLAATAYDVRSGVIVESWQVPRQLGVPLLAQIRR
jgi:uncharacterized protein involved in exopolysaccharide biosynthesis